MPTPTIVNIVQMNEPSAAQAYGSGALESLRVLNELSPGSRMAHANEPMPALVGAQGASMPTIVDVETVFPDAETVGHDAEVPVPHDPEFDEPEMSKPVNAQQPMRVSPKNFPKPQIPVRAPTRNPLRVNAARYTFPNMPGPQTNPVNMHNDPNVWPDLWICAGTIVAHPIPVDMVTIGHFPAAMKIAEGMSSAMIMELNSVLPGADYYEARFASSIGTLRLRFTTRVTNSTVQEYKNIKAGMYLQSVKKASRDIIETHEFMVTLREQFGGLH